MSEWHGWSRTEGFQGEAVHVGPLPGRKSIALYTMDYRDGATMHVHAYFRNEDEAKNFLQVFDRLMVPK